MLINDESKTVIGMGALIGALAWIVGYGFTYVLAIGDITSDEKFKALEFAADESLSAEMIGMLFYNAHNVTITVPQYSILQALKPNHNFISAEGGSTLFLYCIPIVVLIVAGAVVTKYTRNDRESMSDAALTGTTVMVGYLPLVVLASSQIAIDLGEGAMRPDLLLMIGLAGTYYPLIFGAIGGIAMNLATRVSLEGSVFNLDST